MTKNCFLCNISADEKIVENKDFFSAFDDFPVSKGHVLVISKAHVASVFELSSEQYKNLFSLLNETKEILRKKFNPGGFNIGINEGEAAGQSIFHLHVHLIPRYKGDMENPKGGVRNIFPGRGDYTPYLKNPKDLEK